MQKIKKLPYLAFIVAILFVTGFTFSSAFFTRLNLGTPNVLGEEDKDEDQKEVENDDEKDEDGEEEEKDSEDKNKEEDEDDDQRESKNKALRSSQKVEDDEDDIEDDDADEIDEDGVEGQGDVDELNKKIKKTEARIKALEGSGVVVSSFWTTLAEVKELSNQAQVKLVSAPKEAEKILEIAEHKLERLGKLVKMTLGDEDEEESDDDAIEEIQDLAKDVAKLELKLKALSERGMDVSALGASLDSIKEMLSQAKELAVTGDLAGAEALTEVADKKFETLKHAVELAFGEDDEDEDEDEAKEYKNEVAQFVHNLKEIGDMDGGIGQQVRVVAEAQNDSVSKIENSINEINGRNGFVKFLIGPKYENIAEVQKAIVENKTRIEILIGLASQVTDTTIKQVLQDQIKQFQQENARLQSFVNESEDGTSLFGWLVKMFS